MWFYGPVKVRGAVKVESESADKGTATAELPLS